MKGKYYFRLQHKKKLYELEIKRNITVIQGDSGTGKTHLISLLSSYLDYKLSGVGPGKNIFVETNADVDILTNRDWIRRKLDFDNQIIFCDEGFEFFNTPEFISYVKNSNCYFVFITRVPLDQLSYSPDEVYGLKRSNKIEFLKSVYNEQYSIYNHETLDNWLPDIILTEDEGSGFTFWKSVAEQNGIHCETSKGNGGIKNYLYKFNSNKNLLVIADNAAFGSQIDRVKTYVDTCPNIKLILPESFEFMILNSKLIYADDLKDILERTYDFADSVEHKSWERFYTKYLTDITNNSDEYSYNKNNLKEYYWKYHKNEILKANGFNFLCQNIVKKMDLV